MVRERRSPVNKWAVAVAVAAILAFLYVVRVAVMPFVIAAAIAYVAEPANLWLRWRFSRGSAAATTFVMIMLLLGGLGYWIVASLSADLGTTLREAPQLLHKFFAELFGGEEMNLFGHRLEAAAISQQVLDTLIGGIGAPQQIIGLALYGFAGVTAAVLVIVLIFYFLYSGPQIASGMLSLVPPEYRSEVRDVAVKLDPVLRRYLTGLFVIVGFATLVSWIAIRFALGLPFAFLLALLTGLLELVPVVGPMASATLVGLLSLEQHGLWAVIAFALYVTAFRLLIDRVVGPIVLGRAVSLHPAVVMFVFLAGGLFLGILGVILAVPVAAAVKVVLEHYYAQPTRRLPSAK